MPLHHYIEQYFQQHPESRIKGIVPDIPPLEKRPKVKKVEDQTVHAGAHNIPIRIYTPDDEDDFYPLFVFFHGGDLTSGSIENCDVSCRLLCELSGNKVISVGYQLSAEATAVDDCYNVAKWVAENAAMLGGRQNMIILGGPGIGGYLATAVALQSIQTGEFRAAKQVLHYPILELTAKIKESDYQSRDLYNAKYGIDLTVRPLSSLQSHNAEVPIAPLTMDEKLLAQMPETLIFTAEYDPFCDEGEEYAESLKKAGVPVKLVRFDGGIHGFMQNFPGSPDYMRGYDITSEFLITEEVEKK